MKTIQIMLATGALLASPVLAQQATPPAASAPTMRADNMPRRDMPPGRERGWRRGGALGALSLDGRRVMQDALHGAMVASRPDHDRVAAARDRFIELLSAERLDAAALKRTMDDERDGAQAMKARQQAALLGALQRLSAVDRRAFAEEARGLRERFEGRSRGRFAPGM